MPTTNYYINGTSFDTATAVFTDAAMTQCAPNGFYSDGVISRQQLNCQLLPPVTCDECTVECIQDIVVSGGAGLYTMDADTGTALGAIVIRFKPLNVPDGILCKLGQSFYNGMSTQNYGWKQGITGKETYVGTSVSDCNIVSGSPHTLDGYSYIGSSYVANGVQQTVSVVSGQMQMTANSPGICTMVIPKMDNFSTVLNVAIYGICGDTQFELEVNCPAALSSWTGSALGTTASEACTLTANITYYYVHVNGNGGVLDMYDMLFTDQNGLNKLPAGYYNTGSMSANFKWVRVDVNGLVIAKGVCLTTKRYLLEMCNFPTKTEVVEVTGTLSAGTYVTISEGNPNVYADCVFEVDSEVTSALTGAFITGISSSGACTSQCSKVRIVNTSGSTKTIQYTNCSGNAASISVSNNETVYICMRAIVTNPIPSGVAVTHQSCRCEEFGKYKVLMCGNNTIEYIAIATIPVTIGGLVKISNPTHDDFWFVVDSVSTANPTTTIVSNTNAPTNCNNVCLLYEVTNNVSTYQEVSYVSCAGVQAILGVQGNQTIDVCARANSFLVNPNITITFSTPCS